MPQTLQLSATQFDALHGKWCSSICASLTQRGIANVTYGRAAKLVTVYLKALVIMGEGYDSPFGRNLHPPIDRILLTTLASSGIESPHKAAWRSIKWTQLDQPSYDQLIAQLREMRFRPMRPSGQSRNIGNRLILGMRRSSNVGLVVVAEVLVGSDAGRQHHSHTWTRVGRLKAHRGY